MLAYRMRAKAIVSAISLAAALALPLASCASPEPPKQPIAPAAEKAAAPAAAEKGSAGPPQAPAAPAPAAPAPAAPAPAAPAPAAKAQPAGDRTLKVGMWFPPKHVDPHRESVAELVMVWKNVYEPDRKSVV